MNTTTKEGKQVEEQWRDIPGFPSYQSSNLSRVRVLPRTVHHATKFAFRLKGKILTQRINKRGYPVVAFRINKKTRFVLVHRMVALAWIPNPENKRTINHKDGDKTNSALSNLEWATDQENIQHAFDNIPRKHNTKGRFGAQHHGSVKIHQLDVNGSLVKTWDSLSDVERQMGFRANCISLCARGGSKTSYGYKWQYANKRI